ncbi:MAG: TRAP transporter small permease [Firmicutes bacterium]|nr:TRAP transporter small permease [Bacillota bacterium]
MLKKIEKAIIDFETFLAGTGILLITAIIFVNVVLRYIFKTGMIWVEEFTRYMMIWVVFVASGLAVRRNLHVSMDALFNYLPDSIKRYMSIFIYIVSGLLSLGLTIVGTQYALSLGRTDQVAVALDWFPLWILAICVPIGGIFMVIFYWQLAWRNIINKDMILSLEEGDEE